MYFDNINAAIFLLHFVIRFLAGTNGDTMRVRESERGSAEDEERQWKK